MKKSLIHHKIILIFLVLFSSENVLAQLGFCQGNSGDPIFTETFGTGTINNTLPAGTTTYAYTNGFPNDGFYTVRNGSFGNAFDWHQTEDHTIGDVNGKCLIINAESTAGEFYRTTVSGLCETTTYEFSAWLINLVRAGGFCSTQPSGTIPINVRFEIWDSLDTNLLASGNTGNITETSTPNWEEYGLVFQTLPAQTSVILKMINNGVGGCGNDLAIDDIVFKSCGDSIEVIDPSNNNNVSLCSGETPYNALLTATPDNTVFANHFYQWQESTDGTTWVDIISETNQTLSLTGLTTTVYYRAKVAEYAINLNNTDCITFSDVFSVNINQAGSAPAISCWETATLNNATCLWEITGTQDPMPTIACWETATFNTTTCLWVVNGVQDPMPTGLACWETATFNTTTCLWEVTGAQDPMPTGLSCWETTTFNTTTCVWDIIGTQPAAPTGLACWETATFNNATCLWEVTGTQDPMPTGLSCWETTTFNTTTCVWDIIGTQPTVPTGLSCWETATFNNATCLWEVTGTQDPIPTGLECWETAIFNNVTCLWEISGTQDPIPTLECWETATFNTTTCLWEVTGTQDSMPTGLACWETAAFNNATCLWEVTGTQDPMPTGLECWETATFNTALCDWEITGTQPIDLMEEDIVLCEGEDVTLFANTTLVSPDFLWDSSEITDSIIVSNAGTYSVEVTDGCSTTIIEFYVSQIDKPVIENVTSNGSNIVVEMANTGDFLYSLDGVQYQSSNTFFNVENGLYEVYVKDSNDCNQDVFSHLHFAISIYFTPNNDGFNDAFDLNGIENFNTYEVYIFDRIGKLLKSTKNQPFSWDGTFNNQQLPSADYWYVIILDGQEIKGHFTLKR